MGTGTPLSPYPDPNRFTSTAAEGKKNNNNTMKMQAENGKLKTGAASPTMQGVPMAAPKPKSSMTPRESYGEYFQGLGVDSYAAAADNHIKQSHDAMYKQLAPVRHRTQMLSQQADSHAASADRMQKFLGGEIPRSLPTDPSGPYSGNRASSAAEHFRRMAENEAQQRVDSTNAYHNRIREGQGQIDEASRDIARHTMGDYGTEAELLQSGRLTRQDASTLVAKYRNQNTNTPFKHWLQSQIDEGAFDMKDERDVNLLELMRRNYGVNLYGTPGGPKEDASPGAPLALGKRGPAHSPDKHWRSITPAQGTVASRDSSQSAGLERRQQRAMRDGDIRSARAAATARGQNPNFAEAAVRREQAVSDFYDFQQMAAEAEQKNALDQIAARGEVDKEIARETRRNKLSDRDYENRQAWRTQLASIMNDPSLKESERSAAIEAIGTLVPSEHQEEFKRNVANVDSSAMSLVRASAEQDSTEQLKEFAKLASSKSKDEILQMANSGDISVEIPVLRNILRKILDEADQYGHAQFVAGRSSPLDSFSNSRNKEFSRHRAQFLKQYEPIFELAKKLGLDDDHLDHKSQSSFPYGYYDNTLSRQISTLF